MDNAHMFGNKRDEYPVNYIIRYQCNSGFKQRHPPVIRCRADGQWEKPQVECINGECALCDTMLQTNICENRILWVTILIHPLVQKKDYGEEKPGVQDPVTGLPEKKKKNLFFF